MEEETLLLSPPMGLTGSFDAKASIGSFSQLTMPPTYHKLKNPALR